MKTASKRAYTITRDKVIFDYGAIYCDSPEQLIKSELFADIVERYIEKTASRGSSIFAFIKESLPNVKRAGIGDKMISLFRILSGHSAEEIKEIYPEFATMLSDKERLHEFVEGLYNFWRRFERIIYHSAPMRSDQTKSSIHHAQFINANENLKSLVLSVYRRVVSNITGVNASVYRQLPAGANLGVLVEKINWPAPYELSHLKEIPFIMLSLLEPPLVIYPKSNKRKGAFEEIGALTEDMTALKPNEWFCFPAKVGELTAFIYFHQDFVTLGLSMLNLFEMARHDEIDGKRPDMILLFGVKHESIPGDTVFYEDKESGIFMGLVRHGEEVDYFGYFKKMALTLHNVVMIQRGRMPIHGAMVYVKLKDGGSANVVLVGDSGAGKSETLEALRTLAEDHICEMKVIFDDMGSLAVKDGRVYGYGTEVGAFVRLDDLSPGYAYEEFDRAIFMNPNMVNARLIIPITRYHHIVRGYPVDIFLYANNYDRVEGDRPAVEFISDMAEAIHVFRNGARMAKGTTDEKGLVHTYFANPFGAPQRKTAHEIIAKSVFAAMYESGVKVGVARTRLGIEGYEQEGPRAASMELFNVIRSLAAGKKEAC